MSLHVLKSLTGFGRQQKQGATRENSVVTQHQQLSEIPGKVSDGPLSPNWSAPRPTEKATVIRDDADAIAAAERLAPLFAAEASDRDRTRRYGLAEIDAFSQSGLWGITIPKADGGAGVSQATVARVFATLAAGDPSLTQLADSCWPNSAQGRVSQHLASVRDARLAQWRAWREGSSPH